MKFKFLVVFYVIFGSLLTRASDQSSSQNYNQLDRNYHDLIVTNNFCTTRGFYDYFSNFINTPGFLDFAKTLVNERVLDAGSGECCLAKEWLGMKKITDHSTSPLSKMLSQILESSAQPYITAITFSHKEKIEFHERLKILKGAFFSNIQDKDIGAPHSFKLIFDYFGIAFYSVDFVTVLNRYLGLLAKDGYIAIVPPQGSVHTLSGENISIKEWLERKGLTFKGSGSLLLIQNSLNNILPPLKYIEMADPKQCNDHNMATCNKIYKEVKEQEMKSSLEMHVNINSKEHKPYQKCPNCGY